MEGSCAGVSLSFPVFFGTHSSQRAWERDLTWRSDPKSKPADRTKRNSRIESYTPSVGTSVGLLINACLNLSFLRKLLTRRPNNNADDSNGLSWSGLFERVPVWVTIGKRF